jgi:hypothetical protein
MVGGGFEFLFLLDISRLAGLSAGGNAENKKANQDSQADDAYQ